jgi:hypothetical protein
MRETVQGYCCYCLDKLGILRSIEVISSESDEQAKMLAMEILESKRECFEIDLWGRAQRIHVLRRQRIHVLRRSWALTDIGVTWNPALSLVEKAARFRRLAEATTDTHTIAALLAMAEEFEARAAGEAAREGGSAT